MRHYQIHAGLYLTDKEFRYIMILRNKTAAYPALKELLLTTLSWVMGAGHWSNYILFLHELA